jgi:peptidyl-prolyl cis-trans isomerase SurA
MKFKAVVPVALFLAFAAVPRAEIIEQILVKVNGEIFTKSDLEQRQVAALRAKGQQFDPKNPPSDEQLKKALDDVTPQIMVDAVDEMLVVQRGKELGYKLSDEQFKSVVDNIKKENKLDSEEQFQAALKGEGMTMADLRRNLERNMITQRVQTNEVLGKIGVTDDEARAYYDAHIKEFTTSPSVTLRELLVTVSGDSRGVNVAADEAAKARADQLRARVTTGGEAFDKVAAEASDAPSRANSGLIGPLSVTDISPDLRALIEPLKPGDVTQVIRTPRGYQLFKLESRTATQTMTLEQARDQIGEHVFADKRKREFQKYLEKLRTQAIIEWKNPELHKAYDLGVQQAAAAAAAPTTP